ncbi:MAG: hypothetical protein E7262_01480 [Lachnospiraceae bacterium]|nr:hypothetical protein [Lachnospiraceae bacterium]
MARTMKYIEIYKYTDIYETTTQYIVKAKGKYEGFVTCEEVGLYTDLSSNLFGDKGSSVEKAISIKCEYRMLYVQ